MAQNQDLIIVESPAKARTIARFMTGKAKVLASYGHVRDLPKSTLGVDVENHFVPKYVVPKKAAKVISDLKTAAKSAKAVYLATDPDREGEAIAWHVADVLDLLGKKNTALHRITFHEITDSAIKKALAEPGDINMDLVDAQQARRVVDRLVGYSVSPLLWRVLYRGLSAGRVQSVALRLIVEREEERDKFTPVEYWSLIAIFETEKRETFAAKLAEFNRQTLGKYPAKEIVAAAAKLVNGIAGWQISDVMSERSQRHPSPPFTTSTLQQEASRKLHFSAKQTMMLAQKLYEGVAIGGETVGLITYMRTDSLNLAEEAVTEARRVAGELFGPSFVPVSPRRYKTKSKGAQEAHEAIRPTSFARTPDKVAKYLDPKEQKLYKLIWDRAIASQMVSADVERTQIKVAPTSAEQLVFAASGTVVVAPGFLKVYEEGRDKTGDEAAEEVAKADNQTLPKVTKGERVALKDKESKQHFTEPPPRFTEASLVKELEKRGIGRPSTYAPTMSTIVDRGYVIKESGAFTPQEVGRLVTTWLKEHFPEIVDYDFTARMEGDLDDIADGEKPWERVVEEFYKPFKSEVDKVAKDKTQEKIGQEETDEKCPECGKPLAIKRSRYGKFFACTGFPECRYTRPFNDELSVKENEKVAEKIEDRKCPKCGGDLVLRSGRFGQFIGCSNYPKCRFIESMDKTIEGLKCPKDQGDIVEKRTKRGKVFWGCGNYPKCDWASWNKPTSETCPECGAIMVEGKNGLTCSVGHDGEGKATSKPKKATRRKAATK